MKKNRNLILGLGLIAAGLTGLAIISPPSADNRMGMMGMMMGKGMKGCDGMMGGTMMRGGGMMGGMMKNMEEIRGKTAFSSNGERIFYTGINARGEAIKNSHGMQGVGCAMCHGADAKGMKMMMDVPALTWDSLTAPAGHAHPNGRKHPPYTEPSFKVCVLAGADPGGNRLSEMMPRWQMSKEDLDDLIAYLKTKGTNP
ncbi:MAG TPA: c-type cytochrome [Sedimenticola sp.]|nr:c-type cytochrome [Sedimenticola sp.]